MELKRQQPIVEQYHFDLRFNKEEEKETKIHVGFMPMEPSVEDYPKENSIIAARLQFEIVMPDFIVSGTVGQVNHVINQKITTQDDLTKEELDQLVAPLFDILQRLTYEVTEIVTDQPGISLNFTQGEE